MSQAIARRPRMSVAEFVELIRPYTDEERWELLDGEAVLMAPQSERHQGIVGNLYATLRTMAQAKGCKAFPGLGLLSDVVDDYAPIPDVVVRCGPPLDGGYAKDPILVGEVVSPSTVSNDRGRKLDFYRRMPTMRTILIVYQAEVRVEAWQRDDDEWRWLVLKDRSAVLLLPELDDKLRLADVYEGIGPLA